MQSDEFGQGEQRSISRSAHYFTIRYAILGALFGACFPIGSTLLDTFLRFGHLSLATVVSTQQASPLHAVIDTAPFFLGLFASFAGRREDALVATLGQLSLANDKMTLANEKLENANDQLETANAALIQAAQLKSQFLANMSHELRTPLNAIIGFSRIVMRKTGSLIPDKQLSNLRMVHESGLHLLALINDLLDIERIEAGMLRVSTTEVDVRELLADVVVKLRPMATDKGIALEFDDAIGPGHVKTDATRLRQILDNLVTNAIKYSDSGTVTLAAHVAPADEPKFVRFSVRDEGIGIPADQLGLAFEAFRQLDGSTTRSQGGVGLGLNLVHRLAVLLGGAIEVESEVGRGSTFTLVLPADAVLTKPKASSPPEVAGRGPMVLVIDDQPQAREILQTELVDGGFRVHTAASGHEGLEKAHALSPDVILLDIVMPGMDGWEVLERIRKSPALCATPVVITSMLSDTPLAHDLGALAWLTKPVSVADLWKNLRPIGFGVGGDVLVVEDDPATRELLTQQLAGFEATVRTASGYRDAVAELESGLPRLVVLDLMLPDGDGLTLLEAIRKAPGGRDVAVIVYTAKELSDAQRATLSEGLTEVVIKASPQGLESLTEKVRSVVKISAEARMS